MWHTARQCFWYLPLYIYIYIYILYIYIYKTVNTKTLSVSLYTNRTLSSREVFITTVLPLQSPVTVQSIASWVVTPCI